MANKSYEVEGLQELEQNLLKFEADVASKVLGRAASKAGAIVQRAMKRNAEQMFYNAAGESKHEKAAQLRNIRRNVRRNRRGKKSSNTVTVNIGPTAKATHAIHQEFGTSRQAAHPFMRPALVENAEAAIGEFKSQLVNEIAKANDKR